MSRAQDRLLARWRQEKTWWVRIAHAAAFEGGLTIAAVTLATWWLHISYWHVFLLDAVILLFFMPYAVVYNWAYDMVRARWLHRAA
ncbi:PACE efflux transporter [Paucibacter soli]|uniref:PACE efflux transporter n=1 Tax=Paucibacter soli TaxID=3133433 RepID=UPI0030AEAD99